MFRRHRQTWKYGWRPRRHPKWHVPHSVLPRTTFRLPLQCRHTLVIVFLRSSCRSNKTSTARVESSSAKPHMWFVISFIYRFYTSHSICRLINMFLERFRLSWSAKSRLHHWRCIRHLVAWWERHRGVARHGKRRMGNLGSSPRRLKRLLQGLGRVWGRIWQSNR